MNRTVLAALILVMGLGLAGCGGDGRVKDIKKVRKSGNVLAAREQAMVALGEDSESLPMWCELAFCDAATVRQATELNIDAVPILIEAALICAAVNVRYNGSPTDDWKSLSTMVSVEATTEVNRILGGLEVKNHASMSQRSREFWGTATLGGDPQISGLRSGPQWFVNPTDFETAVPPGVALLELIRHLPQENKGLGVNLSQLEDKLTRIESSSNIDPGVAQRTRQNAVTRTSEAVARAVEDLKDFNYFVPATIFQNGILD